MKTWDQISIKQAPLVDAVHLFAKWVPQPASCLGLSRFSAAYIWLPSALVCGPAMVHLGCKLQLEHHSVCLVLAANSAHRLLAVVRPNNYRSRLLEESGTEPLQEFLKLIRLSSK